LEGKSGEGAILLSQRLGCSRGHRKTRGKGDADQDIVIGQQKREMSDLVTNPRLCKRCGVPDCKLKCPCKQVNYCGPACQKADWPSHKPECAFALDKQLKKARREHGKDNVEVANARMDAGLSHMREGRFGEAERCFLKARQVFTAAHGEENADTATACMYLGQVYDSMARYDESIKMLQLSLRIFRCNEVTSRGEVMGVGQSLHIMGRSLANQGKFEEALERLEEAHGIFKEALGEEYASVAHVLCDMGDAYWKLGQDDKALEIHHECLRISRLAQHDEHLAKTLLSIGCILMSQDRLVEARASLEEALEILRRLHSDKHPNVAGALHNIGTILARQGEYDEALKLLRRGLKIYRRTHGDAHEEVGKSLMNIGRAHHGQGKYDEAVRMFEEALDVYTRALGIDNERNATAHDLISLARYESGHLSGALESAKESVRICDKLGTASRLATSQAGYAAEWLRKLEGEV